MSDLDYSVYYSHWHDETPEHARAMAAFHAEQLRPMLRDVPRDGRVLDVGCGMGFALLGLRELGFTHVEGIDRDAAQVQRAKAHGLEVELVKDAAPYLEAADGERYAAVLLLDVLEHVEPAAQVSLLRAILVGLRPGGRLVLTVPNALSPVHGYWRHNDFTHHSSFTVHSLRFVLLNAGFASIEFAASPARRRPSLRLWRAVARSSAKQWLLKYAWREMVRTELGDEVAAMPMDLNLTATAVR